MMSPTENPKPKTKKKFNLEDLLKPPSTGGYCHGGIHPVLKVLHFFLPCLPGAATPMTFLRRKGDSILNNE